MDRYTLYYTMKNYAVVFLSTLNHVNRTFATELKYQRDLTRLPSRGLTLDSRWTRKPLSYQSRVQHKLFICMCSMYSLSFKQLTVEVYFRWSM